jgi:5-methylcytosine-specific restriction endonuclease McrA
MTQRRPFPTPAEISEPLLVLLYNNGGALLSQQSYIPLADHFDLSSHLRMLSRNDHFGDGRSEPAWHQLIQNTRQVLRDKGLLLKSRRHGEWTLSAKGRSQAAQLQPRLSDMNISVVPTDRDAPPPKVRMEVYRRLRDTKMARLLKAQYGDECQLCGKPFRMTSGVTYSEAHHVKPLGGSNKGLDRRDNLIVLCPNHHAEMDAFGRELKRKDLHFRRGHDLAESNIRHHNRIWKRKTRPQP